MKTVELKLMILVSHLFPFNWACNRNKWVCLRKKDSCSCVIGEDGITTQRQAAILGNRSKRLRNTAWSETNPSDKMWHY